MPASHPGVFFLFMCLLQSLTVEQYLFVVVVKMYLEHTNDHKQAVKRKSPLCLGGDRDVVKNVSPLQTFGILILMYWEKLKVRRPVSH